MFILIVIIVGIWTIRELISSDNSFMVGGNTLDVLPQKKELLSAFSLLRLQTTKQIYISNTRRKKL